ncbi:unnamed protein product [Penicillium bialowiezense]
MSASLKRKRADSDDGKEAHVNKLSQQEASICASCEREAHEGDCSEKCPNCDRRHRGKCTAFCRVCVGIGHKWLHCPYSPYVNPRARGNRGGRRHGRRRKPATYISRVNINVPVVNESPVDSPEALSDSILSNLRVALRDLEHQGVSTPTRVTMSNVNISTNLIARTDAIQTPFNDQSLLERVQRAARDPRPTVGGHPLTAYDPRSAPHDAHSALHDPRSTAYDPRFAVHDARSAVHDPRFVGHNPRFAAHDARSAIHDARSAPRGLRPMSVSGPGNSQRTTSHSFVSQSQSRFDFAQPALPRSTPSPHTFGRSSFQPAPFTFPNRERSEWSRYSAD